MNEKIHQADLDKLAIISYPDPRLRENCTEVDDASDAAVAALAEKMFAIMFRTRGVGLAAPQVGVTVRMFVACPSTEPQDRRVYINPQIIATEGAQEAEEGCLSFPGIYSKIKRHNKVTVRAQNLAGEWFEETLDELGARMLEHEIDHLNGRLLVDRMNTVSRLSLRKALKELEDRFVKA
jgi:peptide deformylase